MGRSMVVCAAVVALSTAVHAAGTGVKVGVNYARQELEIGGIDQTSDWQTGITVGEVTEIGGGAVTFQTGIQYAMKGGDDGGQYKYALLEVPGVFKFGFAGGKCYAAAGLNLGFLLSAEDPAGADIKDTMESVNLECVIGVGGSFMDGKLGVGFQLEQGLSNLTKTVGEELELTTLQVVTTLRF